MLQREIAITDRRPFFTCFSTLHDGALVTLRADGRDEVIDQPFHGLSVDGNDVIINTGSVRGPHHGHRVPHVTRVRLEQTDEGADAAIAMISEDGSRTDVRFRSPMRGDLLESAVE